MTSGGARRAGACPPLAIIAIAALLAACGGDGDGAKATPSADEPTGEVTTITSEEGPVKAVVEVWPAKPVIGDAIHLRITVTARDGVEAELPSFDQALGRFSVVSWSPVERSVGVDGLPTWQQGYALQAPMSGRHRIPRLRVEWPDGELLTDEVPLDISTALPEGSLVLRDAKGAIDPEVAGSMALWWLVGLAAIGLGVGGFFFVRAARRAAALRVRVSAYDVAMQRLAALEHRGLPDASTADPWYVELSGIVRRYLEDRYAVRAPELTTEEFLREAKRSPELTAKHRELLTSFLEDCDRVKFAGYRPDAAESQRVLGAARVFVEDTRLRVEGEAARAAVVKASTGTAS